MEDSFSVHRRRKLAGRKREKTPEALQSDEREFSNDTADEDEERRARLERMVEDTEKLEMETNARNDWLDKDSEAPKDKSKGRPTPSPKGSVKQKPSDINLIAASRNKDLVQDKVTSMDEQISSSKKSHYSSEKEDRNLGPKWTQRDENVTDTRDKLPSTWDDEDERNSLRAPKERRRHLSPQQRYTEDDDDDLSDRRQRSSRSPSIRKKQIILINEDSLMADLSRAQKAHKRSDKHYNNHNEEDDNETYEYNSRKKDKSMSLRKRKPSLVLNEKEKEESNNNKEEKEKSWYHWLPFFGSGRQKVKENIEEIEKKRKSSSETSKKVTETPKTKVTAKLQVTEVSEIPRPGIIQLLKGIRHVFIEFQAFCKQNPQEVAILYDLRNLCIAEMIIALIYCGLGGFMFRFTEGSFESFYKCGVKRVKRDFLDTLWNYSHNLREDDWKSLARRKLMEFEEQLHEAHEAGVQSYSGQKSWSFLNAVVYCITVVTTIGYGHIAPSTMTGRALTIIYAIFGIPMFLIILADFGKLFTRGIKFLWAFVRRLYYTGSCRQVRRTVPVQDMMKGVQLVYDLATFRRPSQMNEEEAEDMQKQQLSQQNPDPPETPATPAMSTFTIDDEFNLPISVAFSILLGYIFIGATIYQFFMGWDFFESFYFVFISMSTIGFGDYVPTEPLIMMGTLVYLTFGLALTSMCINVVQVMLSDQFKQASQKISATIGFQMADDGSLMPASEEGNQIQDAASENEVQKGEKIAPKAKPEDIEL